MTIHCRWFSSLMPRLCPMAGSAGSMESMARALTAIRAAIRATNCLNPMPDAAGDEVAAIAVMNRAFSCGPDPPNGSGP